MKETKIKKKKKGVMRIKTRVRDKQTRAGIENRIGLKVTGEGQINWLESVTSPWIFCCG